MAAKQVPGPSRPTEENAPMCPWNKEALKSMRQELGRVNMAEAGMIKKLEKSDILGPDNKGFLSREQLQVVESETTPTGQMMKVIDFLLEMEDKYFECFCKVFEESNFRLQATRLRDKAEEWKRFFEFPASPQPAEGGDKAEAEAVEPEAIKPEAKRRAYPKEEMRLWKFINGVFSQLERDCPIFGILVIGETGTGKSTLINNLLGCEVAVVGHSMKSETQLVTPHERSVEGVPVVVYDTPGLDDTSGDDDPKHLEIMKSLLDRKRIHLVIYCMKLTESRMRKGLIRTFQEYHKIGVPWKQTVIALTFADYIVAETTEKISMVQEELKETLVERVEVTSSVVRGLKICPTAKDPNKTLPNGKQWYVSFWLDVLEVLVPAALATFLYIHKDNIHMEDTPAPRHPNPVNINLVGEDQERFQREMDRLPKLQATTTIPVQVIQDHAGEFLQEMNSAVLAPQLKALGLIPETVESKVLQSKSKKAANAHLLNHLKVDADEESVMEVLRIASEEEGYGRMKTFAAGVLRKLQQGS